MANGNRPFDLGPMPGNAINRTVGAIPSIWQESHRIAQLEHKNTGAGAGTLAAGLNQAANVLAEVARVHQQQEVANAVGEANIALGEYRAQLDKARLEAPERNEDGELIYSDAARKGFKEAEDALNAKTRNLPKDIREKIEARRMEFLRQAELHVSNTQRNLVTDKVLGELATSGVTLAEAEANTDNPLDRQRHREFYATLLNNAVQSGHLSERGRAELYEKYDARVLAKRRENLDTTYKDENDNDVNAAARATIDQMGNLELKGRRRIENALAGLATPAQIQQEQRNHVNELWAGRVRGRIEEDPIAARDELKAGRYDEKLLEPTRLALLKEAESEIHRREIKALGEMKARHAIVKDQVRDFQTAVMLGYDWAGNVAQLRRAVSEFPDLAADFNQAAAFAHEKKMFSRMNDVAREQYIRAVEQRPQTGDSAKFIESLRKADTAIKTELAKDPLSFAARQRLIPPLNEIDLSNPATLKRRSEQARMTEAFYGRATSPFTDDETNTLIANMQKLPAEQRVALMRAIAQNITPGQVAALAAQIDKKGAPVLAQAFGMSTQQPEAASRILQGGEIRASNPRAFLPTGEGALTSMDEKINRRLSVAYAADPNALAAARESVKNVYAWASRQVNDLDHIGVNNNRLDNAITTVTGGLIRHNGHEILPPRYGVSEADFRSMVKRADTSQADYKGDLNADIIRYGTLVSMGPGRYYVRIGGRPIHDKAGRAFILDLNNVGPEPAAAAVASRPAAWVAPTVAGARK